MTSVEVSTDVTTESFIWPTPNTNQNLYFDITFDKINQKIGVRHHVRGKRNAMLNMVQGFATLERIGSYGMSNVFPSPEAIRNLKISDILPSSKDEMALKFELAVIVSRILTTYVPAYDGLDTVWSIPHQYSTQSAFRSEIVPLGILNKDESTTAGMIEILESYKEYVPENEDGDPLPLLLYCDGLSCERVEGAQRARINGADRTHMMNSSSSKVTEKREHCTISSKCMTIKVLLKIMDCFDKAETLLEFVTEGYIILYAMQLSGMREINDTPKAFPDSPEERRKYRDELSKRIVEKVIEKVNTKEVIHVAAEPGIDSGNYCICGLDVGGPMVYCNNQYCQRGSWFHLECLGMEKDDVQEGEWFCSEECRRELELSLSRRKKMTADRFKDSKHEYVKRLIWRGLNDIARHDAVKENDGPRMIRYWKFDLFEFYEKNHPKYLIFGLRLIANIAGATSERLKHALIWERTVNLKGGKRKNIPKDLHCEHLNREYKESSRDAGGQLTTDTTGTAKC
ncbi:hypothetical protein CHS0354_007381 [Potamilus streckersoni]|uniref:Zinc finger PHD-type domain-containing protein n=1 Tax=Potamilus streckersoni TaxID=2493646 RepID=A0AAE0TIL6_9BIVA|nr:hypothetical protein CHS0354_007381 [Potamilus streckersoni]